MNFPSPVPPFSIPFNHLASLPGFTAFCTTRLGGHSQGSYQSLNLGLHVEDDPSLVRQNRRALWAFQGLEGQAGVCLQQVHGSAIARVDASHAHAGWEDYALCLPGCDGAVTSQAGLMLTIGMADCLALVLADPVKRLVGVAHAGWRGALAGIAKKLVQTMKQEHGCQAGDLLAGLSPCLGPCCLELSEEQHRAFSAEYGREQGGFCSALEAGHFKLDLWAWGRQQLLAEGLSASHIETQAWCTSCHPQAFFSHRRDKQKTGRMWLVAGFKEKRAFPRSRV